MDAGDGPFRPSIEPRSLGYRLAREIAGGSGTVRLVQRGDRELRVEVSRADGTIGTSVIAAGEDGFLCTDGGVWVKGPTAILKDGTGYSRAYKSTTFRKTVDGSLAGQHRNAGFGLVLWLIPIPVAQEYWFMWPRRDGGAGRP